MYPSESKNAENTWFTIFTMMIISLTRYLRELRAPESSPQNFTVKVLCRVGRRAILSNIVDKQAYGCAAESHQANTIMRLHLRLVRRVTNTDERDGAGWSHEECKMHAECISIRRTLQYEDIFGIFYFHRRERGRGRGREGENPSDASIRSTLQKWTINRREPDDRFINAKRREIIRNRAEMNYTLRK